MSTPIQYPTEGGSYMRKPDGNLDLVEQTKPAPEPAAADEASPTPTPAPAMPEE